MTWRMDIRGCISCCRERCHDCCGCWCGERDVKSIINAECRSIIVRAGDMTTEISRRHGLLPHLKQTSVSLVPFFDAEKETFCKYKVHSLAWNGNVPHCLGSLVRVDSLPSQQRLRSASFNQPSCETTKLSTVGNRAFVVAAPRIWNKLLIIINFSVAFRQLLKRILFQRSNPDITCWDQFRLLKVTQSVVLAVTVPLSPLKFSDWLIIGQFKLFLFTVHQMADEQSRKNKHRLSHRRWRNFF